MTISLRANLPVDDTDPNIVYSAGDWQEQTGSSRQWDSTVHITSNNGATISFSYSGEAFVIYGTTPIGSNNVIFDVSIDGGSPTTVTKACGSDEQFEVDLFESPIVDFTVHTVVITNRGGATDAMLMFDNLKLYSNDIKPSMASLSILTTPASTRITSQVISQAVPPPISTSSSIQVLPITTSVSMTSSTPTSSISSTSSQSSIELASAFTTTTAESTTTFLSTDSRGSTAIFTQTFTTSSLASSQTGSVGAIAGPWHHIGVVMASVFGGLAFLLLIIVAFLVMRRRRENIHTQIKEDERGLVLKKSQNGKPSIIPRPFKLTIPHNPTRPETSGKSSKAPEKVGDRKYNASNENHGSEAESTAGPSFSNQSTSNALLNQNTNRGFSSAAQSDSTTSVLSHRHSASIVRAAEGGITPTMSSMYASSVSRHEHDAPPAYQPLATGTGI